jgi:hypothetical protein
MKAKVNIAKLGYEKIFVSFNGTSLQIVNGQTVTSEDLIKAYPQYFDILHVEETPVTPVVEPVVESVLETVPEEPKEEILTEDSSEVTAEVAEETPVVEPVVTTKGRKKSK